MALPNSGAISFSMLNLELYHPETQQISLDDPKVRGLAGKTSGVISLDDLRGKYAGAKLTAGQIDSSTFGFRASPLQGELVGIFGGVSMKQVTWTRLSPYSSRINLVTVSGANKPTATQLLVLGPNFELVLQRSIISWSLSSEAWKAEIFISTTISNPFPNGSTRWIS